MKPLRTCLALLVLLALSGHARAQRPQNVEDLNAEAAGGVTYLELLRQLFPDARDDEGDAMAAARSSVPVRSLEDGARFKLEAPFEVWSVQSWRFKSAGLPHLALLVNTRFKDPADSGGFDTQYTLAVFRPAAPPARLRLVEAVDPQTDRFVTFPEDLPLVSIGPGRESFWILCHHHNAGEEFRDYRAVTVSGDSLRWSLKDLPGLYSSDTCEAKSVQSLEVVPLKAARRGELPYEFRVETLRWRKRDCEQTRGRPDRRGARVYRAARVRGGALRLRLIRR
ncbi:MAG TPA: hypothetical protein VGX48_01245 [Pyrinomonadaceae bacterium]|jgi:hypothetical protein|nr:hypothetical protein [Pyrinomonadaceae bacterium]